MSDDVAALWLEVAARIRSARGWSLRPLAQLAGSAQTGARGSPTVSRARSS
jgi:hypothetical protein